MAIETYMKEHFSSYQRTLRRLWEVKKDNARRENYPQEMWDANVQFWKTPYANRKIEHMRAIHGELWEPVALQ
jgi:hypothetical protein